MIPVELSIETSRPELTLAELRWQASAERIDEDILILHNGLPHLRKIVSIAETRPAMFEKSQVVDKNTSGYEEPDHRQSSQLGLSSDHVPDDLSIYHVVCDSVRSAFIRAYREVVNPFAKATDCLGYSLLRYRPGQFFSTHVDVVRGHPTYVARQVSVVAFCNQDLEGGELYFPRQGLQIVPEAGAVVLFPSVYTHPHASLPVRAGTKYSVVSWYY